MRILWVGNSFIAGVPDRLARLARARSQGEAESTVLALPGATLAEHAQSGRFERALATGRWDVIVLQDGTERALTAPEAAERDARRLHELACAAGARTLLLAAPGAAPFYERLAAELGADAALVPAEALGLGDGRHPSAEGAELVAAVVYERLFR